MSPGRPPGTGIGLVIGPRLASSGPEDLTAAGWGSSASALAIDCDIENTSGEPAIASPGSATT